MKHLIVFNEAANEGKQTIVTREVINEKFNGLDYEVYVTEGPRAVIPFLRKYLADNKADTVRVYACGGDGTVNEVVNGMVGFDNAELAILACGTGNDFVKIYGGAEKFRDFAALINGDVTSVDLSKVEGGQLEEPMYSINVVNLGFDAIVGAMGNYYKEHGYPDKVRAKGKSPYDYALSNDAMKHGRFNDIELSVEGEKLNDKQLLLGSIAQGQWIGGKFHASPKSDNTDGLLDICIMKPMTIIGLGMIIGPYTKGTHLNKKNRKIVYRRAKSVDIVAPKAIDLCVDGEMIKGANFKITCMPKALKLVLPRE